ncbi:unnamed protein product [Somion occarium]|uniref:RING-type domain-containing protein n=1 Tax=Somion occarium TaxID=3059160 RepID=A0ABP1D514_9APHY
MDNLKCNILTCRTALSDKAVVTTCSHIFCVDCANTLFNDSRLCPACETSLTEPDDVVVCSLHPSNDYKTSVLSGLNPATILEICSRAMSFWQYQCHQELAFQLTVLRNVSEKSGYLQKELDNAVREARGQISLLNSKISELERDLELERRKSGTLQDSLREREKEYQKLKGHLDKIKRKALLAPGSVGQHDAMGIGAERHVLDDGIRTRPQAGFTGNTSMDMGAVIGGMEANGIQRTPIASRTAQQANIWRQPQLQNRPNFTAQRQPFTANPDRSFRSHTTVSDQSENEVENLVGQGSMRRSNGNQSGWPASRNLQRRPNQPAFPQVPQRRGGGKFKPASIS